MTWYEILIAVVAVLFVAGIVAWRIVRRRQGKTDCDCGGKCSACGGACHCKEQAETQKNDIDRTVQSP